MSPSQHPDARPTGRAGEGRWGQRNPGVGRGSRGGNRRTGLRTAGAPVRPSGPPVGQRGRHGRSRTTGLAGRAGRAARRSPGRTTPDSYPKITAWTRSRTSSLRSTAMTCVFTVASLTKSRAPISRFEQPRHEQAEAPPAPAGTASASRQPQPGPAPGYRAKRSTTARVTAGSSRPSPRAIVCTAAISSSGTASLRRKPLAPARSAPKTYSSRSNVVSTRTRGGSAKPGDLAGGVDAVEDRHPDVHHHDVRANRRASSPRPGRPPRRPRPRGRDRPRRSCGALRGPGAGRRRRRRARSRRGLPREPGHDAPPAVGCRPRLERPAVQRAPAPASRQPLALPPAAPAAPAPSSVTSIVDGRRRRRRRGPARVRASACLSTFVSASWTIR